MAWISILGLYEYDTSVFDDFIVPTGVDKEQTINNILLNCAELEIIYTRPDTMKVAIKAWCTSEQRTWQKLYASMMEEYNPIWNVDADISQTERIAGNNNRNIGRNNSANAGGTDTHSVQGFNSATWADADKNVTSSNMTENETVADNATDDHTRTYSERRTGNIGVTATQDLIKKEREIAEFSIIEYITNSFKKRFCLMIY